MANEVAGFRGCFMRVKRLRSGDTLDSWFDAWDSRMDGRASLAAGGEEPA